MTIFDRAGRHLATHRRADLCGVAARGAGFVASGGSGGLWAADAGGLSPLSHGDAQWDNHLVAIAQA